MLDLLLAVLPNILGIPANWDKWPKMVVVKLPDLMPGSIMFGNMFSARVLEWLVVLAGCIIKGINELDASYSKTSSVGLCSL